MAYIMRLFVNILIICVLFLVQTSQLTTQPSSSRSTRNEPQVCQPPPRWTVEGRHVMNDHLGNVTLLALMELQCTFCRNQINSLERLLEYVKQHSLEPTKIIIVAPMNESAPFVEYYKKSLSTKGITVIQESKDEPVWELLNGCNNDFFIYDTCGRLNFHIPYPQSLTYYHYTVNTLYSVHRHQKCGQCDKNGSGQPNPFLHTDPSLLTPKQIKAWVQSMPPGQRQPSQLYRHSTSPLPGLTYAPIRPGSIRPEVPPIDPLHQSSTSTYGNSYVEESDASDTALTTTTKISRPPKRQRGKFGGRRQNRTRIKGGHKIRHEKNKHQQQQGGRHPMSKHVFTTTETTTTSTTTTTTTTTPKYVEEYDPDLYNEYFDVISPPTKEKVTAPSRHVPRFEAAQIPPTMRPGSMTTPRKNFPLNGRESKTDGGFTDDDEIEENGREPVDEPELVTIQAATIESIVEESEAENGLVTPETAAETGIDEPMKTRTVILATKKPTTVTTSKLTTAKIPSVYNSLLGSAECSTFTDNFCLGLQQEGKDLHACCYKGVYITNVCTSDKCSSRTYSLCCFQKFQQARYQCCHNDSAPSARPDDFSKCCHDLLVRDDPCCPTSVSSSYWSHKTRIAELCLPTIDLSFDGVVLDAETKDKSKISLDLGTIKSLKYACPAANKRRDFFYWEPENLHTNNSIVEDESEEMSAAFVQYRFL